MSASALQGVKSVGAPERSVGPSQASSAPLGGSALHAVKSVGAVHTALVMAGGTGGHIFPGLAVAEALRERGWRVHWLGGKGSAGHPSMESQLVPPRGFAFEAIDFSGVRGKSPATLVLLPLRLLRAFWQSLQVVRRVKPDVVLGLGGYICFPAGLMSVLLGKPLVLHEQNSVAGLVNKVLAGVADKAFTAYPGALKKAEVDNGSWRLAIGDDDIAGKIKPGGPSLAGLKLESRYRFTCLEEIEETQGGREQRTLYLTEHEPA